MCSCPGSSGGEELEAAAVDRGDALEVQAQRRAGGELTRSISQKLRAVGGGLPGEGSSKLQRRAGIGCAHDAGTNGSRRIGVTSRVGTARQAATARIYRVGRKLCVERAAPAGVLGKNSMRRALTGGDRRSLQGANGVLALVREAPTRVSEPAALANDEDALVSMRALDLLEMLAHEHPEWVQPHRALLTRNTRRGASSGTPDPSGPLAALSDPRNRTSLRARIDRPGMSLANVAAWPSPATSSASRAK